MACSYRPESWDPGDTKPAKDPETRIPHPNFAPPVPSQLNPSLCITVPSSSSQPRLPLWDHEAVNSKWRLWRRGRTRLHLPPARCSKLPPLASCGCGGSGYPQRVEGQVRCVSTSQPAKSSVFLRNCSIPPAVAIPERPSRPLPQPPWICLRRWGLQLERPRRRPSSVRLTCGDFGLRVINVCPAVIVIFLAEEIVNPARRFQWLCDGNIGRGLTDAHEGRRMSESHSRRLPSGVGARCDEPVLAVSEGAK